MKMNFKEEGIKELKRGFKYLIKGNKVFFYGLGRFLRACLKWYIYKRTEAPVAFFVIEWTIMIILFLSITTHYYAKSKSLEHLNSKLEYEIIDSMKEENVISEVKEYSRGRIEERRSLGLPVSEDSLKILVRENYQEK